MASQRILRAIKQIAAAAGADGYEIIRESKHIVIDYFFTKRAEPARVRRVMSSTLSDNARGLKNQIADLKRAARSLS